jgi:4-alpha-glucanotransferase
LRAGFLRFRKRGATTEFESFCREGGESLLAHALFETLDRHFRDSGISGFSNWPAGFESPSAQGVRAFARSAREALEYQLFLQWLAARSAARAQLAARRSMAIGIIADIAVGMDPQGSHAWSAPHELLRGLHVGAPPDVFNASGQDWGLTTLSPCALEFSGYAPFIATLRAGMRYAGGVRIDHAMGLRRLWVIPAGASPSEGVYLRYPQRELLHLVALESHLNRAIVIGEDLGTVPEGFRKEIAAAGILGMQVLWFERNSSGRFIPPAKWRRDAVAMTTTHDLPTVAGWWTEHDIDWQKRLHRLRTGEGHLRNKRAADRNQLWSAFRRAKCSNAGPPARDMPSPAIKAALDFVGRTRCRIAFAPLEDIDGDRDQPNMPGTVDEHPNWRRRSKNGDLLRKKPARGRVDSFVAARRAT